MAIKEKKVPSPDDIKTSSQNFTNEELESLRNLRSQLSILTAKFGQISINKLKIEEAENDLRKELENLEKEEIRIAKSLSNKYGKGSINLESGTFTPIQ
tara:strand:+ start:3234 stop:3530 length:297 start_codon:yes stop_codon:yes gene_type:complete